MARKTARPAPAHKLTAKQQLFVLEYLVDLNATQAAIRAGYSKKNADVIGPEVLGKAWVRAAVDARMVVRREKIELTAERVLEEVCSLAFVDARSFWDAKGNVKPFSELTAGQGAALAGFEVIIKNAKAGDGVTDEIHKFKFWDKTRALEMLMKHFGQLTEKVEHSGGIKIIHELPLE